MCRLLLANRKGVDYLGNMYGLEFLLETAERLSMGVTECIALPPGRSKSNSGKGSFSRSKATRAAISPYGWCLFHTRS